MATPADIPDGLTIRDALTAAHDLGYEEQFVAAEDGQICWPDSPSSIGAGEVLSTFFGESKARVTVQMNSSSPRS